MTRKQKLDIEIIKHFIPQVFADIEITSQDCKNFLAFSERGIKRGGEYLGWGPATNFLDGYNALIQGKRWRGVHIHEMWKPDVQEGLLLIQELEEDFPDFVITFIKRELNML
jgi:hypothetical protein